MSANQHDKAVQFRALHEQPRAFIIANAWDAGSAQLLAGLGFPAIATSSAASAATLGRADGKITRDEAMAHARSPTPSTCRFPAIWRTASATLPSTRPKPSASRH